MSDVRTQPVHGIFFLMQMADSAFPVGGFAYSYGLESAVKHGFIMNEDQLRDYLITFSDQVISFDFPFVCSAFNQDTNHPDSLRVLLNAYQAMLLNPPVQKAGAVTGRNWLRIFKQLSPLNAINDLDELFVREKLTYDFPIVFALCMKCLDFSLHKALQLFFYMALRDQISALIRLGMAGPSRAHMELQ